MILQHCLCVGHSYIYTENETYQSDRMAKVQTIHYIHQWVVNTHIGRFFFLFLLLRYFHFQRTIFSTSDWATHSSKNVGQFFVAWINLIEINTHTQLRYTAIIKSKTNLFNKPRIKRFFRSDRIHMANFHRWIF